MSQEAAVVLAAPAPSSQSQVAQNCDDEVDETLEEDGRLLKMFVARNNHVATDAKEKATRDWLIRGSFYDRWLKEFVRRYAPVANGMLMLTDEDLKSRQDAMQKACQGSTRPKAEVAILEGKVKASNGDVHQLRDTLMSAVHNLITPKRKCGGSEDPCKLSPEAIAEMKLKRQVRLRRVVYDCLQGIWRSGVGGEVLKHAMDTVQKLIIKFECREDDVRIAVSGNSWHKLKELVQQIEGELPETIGRRKALEMEGRGHKKLIQKALADLGGSASTSEIVQWVEKHPEMVEDENCKLNMGTRDPKGRSKYIVWQSTMRSALSMSFVKSQAKRADGVFVWHEKGAEGALEDQPAVPALPDSSPDAGSSSSAKPNPGKRQKDSGAADLPLEDAAGGASGEAGQPVAEQRPADAEGAEPAPKRARVEPEPKGAGGAVEAPAAA